MKRLICLNGTMGVGKTTTCNELLKRLQPSVFLDGDGCWNMNPFRVTSETKDMVWRNIVFLLNGFLACSEYEIVIFCWVLPEAGMLEALWRELNLADVRVHAFTLTITPEALTERLTAAIRRGERTPDILPRSLERLPLFNDMGTIPLDVSRLTPAQAAEAVIAGLEMNGLDG